MMPSQSFADYYLKRYEPATSFREFKLMNAELAQAVEAWDANVDPEQQLGPHLRGILRHAKVIDFHESNPNSYGAVGQTAKHNSADLLLEHREALARHIPHLTPVLPAGISWDHVASLASVAPAI